jgi:hypothetical protein
MRQQWQFSWLRGFEKAKPGKCGRKRRRAARTGAAHHGKAENLAGATQGALAVTRHAFATPAP